MPDVIKMDYAMKHKKFAKPNKLGPKKGMKGATNWANESRTRGNMTGKFEQGVGAQTKLTSLKRGK